ncbi:MAG: EF-P lysine aminoacylase EpmA, partial [Gammaproteobacteria bacterium]|nr:EF-P lysine aminoacylase EpmA [Gammaproteobacteria bacterium]
EMLQQRARLLRDIREFFHQKGYLEVETPALSRFANPDPYIDSFELSSFGQNYYLHTSPEFAMKRLLAAGMGSIYQICKVFRQGEQGRLHNPEFTMLEWYRIGFDYHQLMDEIDELLCTKCNLSSSKKLTYSSIFQEVTGFNMHQCTVSNMRQYVLDHGVSLQGDLGDDLDAWRDVVMTHFIEPGLGQDGPVFIYDYPVSQAALAQVLTGDEPAAMRFELYFKGIELANGYQEMTDQGEQRRRFEAQQARRQTLGKPLLPFDRYLVDALGEDIPPVSGVALGFDRLLMLLNNRSYLKDILSFNVENA